LSKSIPTLPAGPTILPFRPAWVIEPWPVRICVCDASGLSWTRSATRISGCPHPGNRLAHQRQIDAGGVLFWFCGGVHLVMWSEGLAVVTGADTQPTQKRRSADAPVLPGWPNCGSSSFDGQEQYKKPAMAICFFGAGTSKFSAGLKKRKCGGAFGMLAVGSGFR